MIRPRSQRSLSAFTLIELLVVIAIMGILAGLLVGLAPVAGAKMRESQARAELAALTGAIEAYKAKYGFYPPDGLDPVTGNVDPRINPLYYELGGVQVINPKSATDGRFRAVNDDNTLEPEVVKQVIKRDGFANAGQDRRKLFTTSFRTSQHSTLRSSDGSVNFEVLVVGALWPQNRPDQPAKDVVRSGKTLNFKQPGTNPWRYVSSTPTNNPTTFDLWAEIPFRDRNAPNGQGVRIIGNWKNR